MDLINIGSALNSIWIFIMIASSIGIILTLFFMIRRQLRYNISVEIIDLNTETGIPIHKWDKGGIFFDKLSGIRLFFLKKNKVGLRPDIIPYCQTEWNGFFTKRKKVYLYQLGFKSFAYVTPEVTNPSWNLSVGDEDVSWAELAIERGNRLFVNTMLQQILPYLGLMILSLVLIVMTVYFFKNLGVLKELIAELKPLASEIAKAKAGTVIVG